MSGNGKYLGEKRVNANDTPYSEYGPADWAILFIEKYGGIDGEPHKAWVLDQVARILNETELIIELATWDDGEKEYRISTDSPSAPYLNWVKNMDDYDVGIPP